MNFRFYSNLLSIFSIFYGMTYLISSNIFAQSKWIGATPSELLPGSQPLGSMKGRSFQNRKPAKPIRPTTPAVSSEVKKEATDTPIISPEKPREFSDFHSNLGRQAIVEKLPTKSKNWI